jgi:peptidoglycan/xylan/chitin deacetylase (PgdA/CDA1 family)
MLNITPGFTLSLDCEGLWGMADNNDVVRTGIINDSSLKDAYTFLINTLKKYNVKSTAAFVTGFAAESDAICDHISIFEEMAELNPAWFVHIIPALRNGLLDGWKGADFYRLMSDSGHEMAWHGTTHLPITEQTSDIAIAMEMQLAAKLFPGLGLIPKTIIFPRNQVGHLHQLHSQGFSTYRACLPDSIISRTSNLLNEWNIFDNHVREIPKIESGWNVSPAGIFLNWPSGIRKTTPIAITIMRWKSLLRYAVEHGGYVHMWFHPHNLITAPAMKIAFEEIMRYVGELVQSGDLINLTIAEANNYYKIGTVE